MIIIERSCQSWELVEESTPHDKRTIEVSGYPAGGCDDGVYIEIETKAKGIENKISIEFISDEAMLLVEMLQRAIKVARGEE